MNVQIQHATLLFNDRPNNLVLVLGETHNQTDNCIGMADFLISAIPPEIRAMPKFRIVVEPAVIMARMPTRNRHKNHYDHGASDFLLPTTTTATTCV